MRSWGVCEPKALWGLAGAVELGFVGDGKMPYLSKDGGGGDAGAEELVHSVLLAFLRSSEQLRFALPGLFQLSGRECAAALNWILAVDFVDHNFLTRAIDHVIFPLGRKKRKQPKEQNKLKGT